MMRHLTVHRFLQLGLVGVGTRVGHAEDPPAGVRQVGLELVLERLPPEGLSSWGHGDKGKT